jgi:hypothetical protein
MGEKLTVAIALLATLIMLPYVMTLVINGRYDDRVSELEKVSTGRDVLVNLDGKNLLLDVELYIAGVLPGLVSPDSDTDVIEAQAVAVRTRIYYEMGDKTVINASELDFKYYTKNDFIEKWGSGKYRKVKLIYQEAVLNTKEKIIE